MTINNTLEQPSSSTANAEKTPTSQFQAETIVETKEIIENTYHFISLDPRPNATNEEFDIGIEVTEPRLIWNKPNLDHHWEGATAATPSSCEQALTCELPKVWSRFATVRPDGDSLTAMAILQSRLQGRQINTKIVEAIGILDRLWEQWLISSADYNASLRKVTTSILRIAPDFKVPLALRVEQIQQILEWSFPENKMDELVVLREKEFTDAKANSITKLYVNWKIASVVSTHRFATNLGYEMAQVVVATNPKMTILWNTETYNKHTVCRYNEFVQVDLASALKELNSIEPGWWWRWDIIGSPQQVNSILSNEDVVNIVSKYLF